MLKFSANTFKLTSRLNHTAVGVSKSSNPLKLEPSSHLEHFSSQAEKQIKKYRLELATLTDTNRILNFIEKNYFCDEPLSKSLHLSYKKLDKSLESYIRDLLRQGMTLIAREDSKENKIMGVCINNKSCKWDGDRLDNQAKKCKSINSRLLMHIWALLAREPCIHQYLSQLVIFDLKFISVNKSFKNHGIDFELAKHALNLGRDLNYNFARIDSTNEQTKSIAEKLGMEKLWDVPYHAIFSDNEKTPVAKPESPNEYAAVYYVNLKTMPADIERDKTHKKDICKESDKARMFKMDFLQWKQNKTI